MIPASCSASDFDFTIEEQPTKTYHLHMEKETLGGYCDDLQAMEQAVYKCLHTERYEYVIYSWNYGLELQNLFGQPIPYVYSELKRRITEALLWDDRITQVYDFKFSNKKGEVLATFRVTSTKGEFESSFKMRIA